MGETIRELVMQADDERDFDLIRSVKDILDGFAYTCNCPSDWRCIGAELAREYPEDSWVFENLELCDFIDQ